MPGDEVTINIIWPLEGIIYLPLRKSLVPSIASSNQRPLSRRRKKPSSHGSSRVDKGNPLRATSSPKLRARTPFHHFLYPPYPDTRHRCGISVTRISCNYPDCRHLQATTQITVHRLLQDAIHTVSQKYPRPYIREQLQILMAPLILIVIFTLTKE